MMFHFYLCHHDSQLVDPFLLVVRRDYCEARRREHAEYTRSTDRAFKRQTKEMDKVRRARIADINLSLEDIHKLQSEELTTKKLEEYSSFVNSIVENDSRQCERDFQTFRKSAVTDENMDLIIERTKRDFPISFQFHNGMILPDRVRSTMDTRKKELSALWGFISSIRKRDPRLCISLAGLVSLSLASGKISDSMIKFVNHLGIAASKGVLTNRMKEIAARSANTWEWQANELFIMLFFDNMQYALPYKVQANGKSTNMIEGTSRFARKVIPFEPPDRVPFVTNEGQPKLTYVDQAIPAPINALPFEKLTDEQFVKLLEYEGGIQSALEPSVFQVEILGEESSSHVFDMNKMDPTDGSRCERYIKLLRKCRSYGGFWQYLSCRHTVASARVHAGPLQKHVSDYLDTVAAARKTVLSNARLFHMETVRQWFPQFEEETLTFLFAASIFREKTTQECAKVIVQLLLDCGLLVLCADKKIRVRPDWELYRVFINGDQYTVDKANQFTAKAAASLGAYSDDYESNMNIAKAMTRLLWSHGQLHISFRFCFGCYVIAYPGFLHPFQAAAQVTRLVMDSTKCFQLATTFLRIVYDQLYRGFLFHWLFNVAADGKYETIHDLVNGFDEFRESMYESCDEVYRFIASFFELCEDFFMYLDCVACADQLGCEMLLKHYQPIFYLCGMTNYKEVVWHQMDTMYGSETSIRDRETYRRSLMIRLNKGKSCIGTDTFGELVNLKTVSMNKSKDIKHCAAKSAAVTAVTQADEWRKRNMCFEEPKPPKSSTKKRTSFVRDRISELACVAGLYQETPGRMVSDLSLYSLLDDLETPFPPTEADDDGDDDELTAAERADKERNASIDAAVSGVIRKEDGNKSLSDESDDSESDDDNDEEESASDGGNGKKKRKLLTKNNKVRIGSSTQDLLTIDPKGVAKVNPYTKGKEMIAKDDVKEKRARKKVVQERKVKLVELCFRRICREKEVMSSSYCIHPLPSTDREESQRTYDSLYSPWK